MQPSKLFPILDKLQNSITLYWPHRWLVYPLTGSGTCFGHIDNRDLGSRREVRRPTTLLSRRRQSLPVASITPYSRIVTIRKVFHRWISKCRWFLPLLCGACKEILESKIEKYSGWTLRREELVLGIRTPLHILGGKGYPTWRKNELWRIKATPSSGPDIGTMRHHRMAG